VQHGFSKGFVMDVGSATGWGRAVLIEILFYISYQGIFLTNMECFSAVTTTQGVHH